MGFNVNYNAGGVIDEVKRLKEILGGVIDRVKQVDTILGGVIDEVTVVELVKRIEMLERLGQVDNVTNLENVQNIENVGLVGEVGNIKGGTIDLVKQVNNIGNLEGGTLNTVKEVERIGSIDGFAQFSQPYNEMVQLAVPAIAGMYAVEYVTPLDRPVEILGLTVTATGYGESDKYDLYCDDQLWFKNWYLQEVKEGLFLGSSTYVYRAAPGTHLKLEFFNDSGTSKILWFGIRMLTEKESLPEGGNINE